ncbi:hypothetical protein EVAR_90572_1 [Eumeta japonica]|uniref:Uncharacterized protein n=1 Tax=Eumeta variegata TaxID=151549 RepID=A0A4C1YUR1_EUMVA|nr:hypothetical protein EVAR_90572_1 [Eumeta japonica]
MPRNNSWERGRGRRGSTPPAPADPPSFLRAKKKEEKNRLWADHVPGHTGCFRLSRTKNFQNIILIAIALGSFSFNLRSLSGMEMPTTYDYPMDSF